MYVNRLKNMKTNTIYVGMGIRCYKTFYMTENNNPIDYLFCQFKSIYVYLSGQ